MRYMKCLDYKTPEEAFNIEMEKLKLKKPQGCGMISRVLKLVKSVLLEGLRVPNKE